MSSFQTTGYVNPELNPTDVSNGRTPPRGGGQVISAFEEAEHAFLRDLPSLLAKFPGRWVAYSGPQQIGIASSKSAIYQQCLEQGFAARSFLVRSIEEQVDEIIIGPTA